MRRTLITAIGMMVGVMAACTVSSTESTYLPSPKRGSETIEVYLKQVPPGCTPAASITGLARGTGDVNLLWQAAVTDMRNKAMDRGADAVTIVQYQARKKGDLIEITVRGNGLKCTGPRRARRRPAPPAPAPGNMAGGETPPPAPPAQGAPPAPQGNVPFGVRPPTPAAQGPAEPTPVEPAPVDDATPQPPQDGGQPRELDHYAPYVE